MSVKPVAWMDVDGDVCSARQKEHPYSAGTNSTIYSIPLYSVPAPELAEALRRLVKQARMLHVVETIPVGCESCDAIEDAEKLLARITPK